MTVELYHSLLGIMTDPAVQGLLLLLVALSLLWHAASRDAGDARVAGPVEWLAHAAASAAEEGCALVMPLGRGSAAGNQALDSASALAVARQAVGNGGTQAVSRAGAPCSLVAGDATLWLAAHQQQRSACFVGPDAASYAAGVRNLTYRTINAIQVSCGAFGDDYLLFAEPDAWRHRVQPPAAITTPTVLPFLMTTSGRPALGEELYQAGALVGEPILLRTLPLLERLRMALILIILLGAVLKLLLAA